MRYAIATTAAVLALLLAGCGAPVRPGERPDWVDGAQRRYPAESYLIGRGSSDSLALAADRARADLAKNFEVEISAESSDLQTYERATRGGETARESGWMKITSRYSARTERVIRGMEIAETWRDPDSGTFHALAVLKRRPAAASLREDVRQLDQATGERIEAARREGDPLARIAAASRAVELQVERETVNQTLAVVEAAGAGVPAQWSVERLRADRDALLERVRVEPRAEGAHAAALIDILSGALARAGLTVAGADAAQFVLVAALELDDLGLTDNWFWVKGTLEIELREAGGRVRAGRRREIKAAAQQRADARRRAVEQAAARLDGELRGVVTGLGAEPGAP